MCIERISGNQDLQTIVFSTKAFCLTGAALGFSYGSLGALAFSFGSFVRISEFSNNRIAAKDITVGAAVAPVVGAVAGAALGLLVGTNFVIYSYAGRAWKQCFKEITERDD